MKKHFTVVLLTILFNGISFSQSIKDLDAKNGFRDYKFGDTLTKFKNLKFIDADSTQGDRLIYYSITDDHLLIGNFTVKIEYGFYKGHFSEMQIIVLGAKNVHGVHEVIESLYGKDSPDKDKTDDDKLMTAVWNGKLVKMVYFEVSTGDEDGDTSACWWLNSNYYTQKSEADKKLMMKKAKSDM